MSIGGVEAGRAFPVTREKSRFESLRAHRILLVLVEFNDEFEFTF